MKEKKESAVTQSCLTLRNPMDCSPLDSSIHGIFQARVLMWIAISFSRGSSWPRDQTRVSCIAGRHFTIWATREALSMEHLDICLFLMPSNCLLNYSCISIKIAIPSGNPTPGHIDRTLIWKRYMHPCVHSNTIYNSQVMETAYISIDR